MISVHVTLCSVFMTCSLWVMMNKKTRKLSKMPEEVREEIEPYFLNSAPVVEEDDRRLPKLDDNTADFIRTGLTVCRWFMKLMD